MSTGWSAGEFRRVRMMAVVVMAVGWAAFVLWDSAMCLSQDCVPVPVTAGEVIFAAVFSAAIHLGLLLSFVAERGRATVRVSGMVLMLPTTLLAVEFARELLLHGQIIGEPMGALVLAYGLAHVVQFWALTGVPFPRLAPLTSVSGAPSPTAAEISRGG